MRKSRSWLWRRSAGPSQGRDGGGGGDGAVARAGIGRRVGAGRAGARRAVRRDRRRVVRCCGGCHWAPWRQRALCAREQRRLCCRPAVVSSAVAGQRCQRHARREPLWRREADACAAAAAARGTGRSCRLRELRRRPHEHEADERCAARADARDQHAHVGGAGPAGRHLCQRVRGRRRRADGGGEPAVHVPIGAVAAVLRLLQGVPRRVLPGAHTRAAGAAVGDVLARLG
mmetsp:Transcript_17544/g.39613  ORF Transcript_17544/g.39613 Transcript_17544/m.39613 type:complete len:230 (-) Transcript_17544:209-898(-)